MFYNGPKSDMGTVGISPNCNTLCRDRDNILHDNSVHISDCLQQTQCEVYEYHDYSVVTLTYSVTLFLGLSFSLFYILCDNIPCIYSGSNSIQTCI